MQKEYKFYIPSLFDGIDEMQQEYESQLREVPASSRASYIDHLMVNDENTANEEVAPAALETFMNRLSES